MQDEGGLEAGFRRVAGRVKWFDPTKGFGFIVADDGGSDILLHANVLRNYGQSSVADGAVIEVDMQETERGLQAVEVFRIDPPEGVIDTESGVSEHFHAAVPEVGIPLEPARVKWFDKAKGFGFANVFGDDQDVFLHVEVLRRSGLSDLQPGEAITVQVKDGQRGRMASLVTSWEAALKQDA